MPQARGSQTAVAIFDETTYATDPGTPDGTKLYIVDSGVRAQQPLLQPNSLTSARARSRAKRGNINVSGGLNVEIGAENIGKILKHTMGANTTTGVGPYTHTLTIGSLPTGMVIEQDFGANISGVGRYEKFNGCRVRNASFNFPQEGFCTAAFDVLGAKRTLGSAALDATVTDNGHTPFSSFEGTIQEGGAAIAIVTQLQFTLDNDLDDSVYCIGGAGQRRAAPEGFANISGTLTALFEDATLINKGINDTASSIKVTLTRGTGAGSAGNESIEFFLQNLVYEQTSPGIPGPRGLMLSLPFQGFITGGVSPLQVIVKNAIATI